MPTRSPSVLFVCTGNAGRSQIARALLEQQMGAAVQVDSAGVAPWPALHPMAVRLLEERGLHLQGRQPKSVHTVIDHDFDLLVSIGTPALRGVPRTISSGAHWIHWDIHDPADADGTDQSEAVFRRTITAMEARLPALRAALQLLASVRRVRPSVGLSTGLWSQARFDPAAHLPLIAQAGFDAIELCAYQGVQHFNLDDPQLVHRLKRGADDLGMSVWSIHSRDTGSLGSPDPAERARQLDELHRCVDAAETLGAKIVISHALILGRFADDPRQREDLLRQALEALQARTQESPVSIAFENDTTGVAGRSSRDVLRRLEGTSPAALGFVLDPGHANIAGDLAVIKDTVGPRLISLHLNDNDGKGDLHLTPGAGSVDWNLVREMIQQSEYHGCTMYEVIAGREDPRRCMERTMASHQRLWPR